MSFDPHKNFAYSTVAVAPSPASSGTTLGATDSTVFPTAAVDGAFDVVVWPTDTAFPTNDNAEIFRVTAGTTTWTIVRVQQNTSARSIVVGDQIALAVTAKTLTDVETELSDHEAATTSVHGIADTSALETTSGAQAKADAAAALAAILAPATSARNVIQPSAADAVALTLKGHATQTADLEQWQDSTGAVLLGVGAGGQIEFNPADSFVGTLGSYGFEAVSRALHDPVGFQYYWASDGSEAPLPFDASADYHFGELTGYGWTDAAIADKDTLTGRLLSVGVDADGASGYWIGDEVDVFAQNDGSVAAASAVAPTGRKTFVYLLDGSTASLVQGEFVAAYVNDAAIADQLWGANFNAIWFSGEDVPTSVMGFIADAQMHGGAGASAPLVIGAAIDAENHHSNVDLLIGVRAGVAWTAGGVAPTGAQAWLFDSHSSVDDDFSLAVFGGVRIAAAPWGASGGASVTDAYGLYVTDPASAGASVTNKWAVWAETGTWFMGNTTAPGSDPTGGGYLYASSGALYWRGSSGTITKVANA